MRKYLTEYLRNLEALLSSGEEIDYAELEQSHLIMIQFMQHERLIHLIVTVLFALAMLIVFGVFVLSGAMYILALLALILVLLVPYIVHYFHLENGVQKMYTLIDELEKRKGQ